MTANHVDNHEKFTKLYELYSHDLLCFAISIVKSPLTAEDLVHDAYGKILKHIDEIEEPDSPRIRNKHICQNFPASRQVSKISGTGGLRDGASKRTFYTIYGK